MTTISHTAAFRAQSDFAPEAQLKIGHTVWTTPGTAGHRFYTEVLAKHPTTVQKVIDLAAKLDQPFSDKAVMGHLKWLFTAGQLEVDGVSYNVPVKAPKPAKVEAPKAEAPKAEAVKPEAKPARKPRFPGKRKAA